MNAMTPQRWVGALLLAHALINCIAWLGLDQPFSDVRTVVSLFLAFLFLAPFAGRKVVAIFLMVLAASYALGTMNAMTPQRWVGALLLAHALINCIAWLGLDQPFSDVRTVVSLFLAFLFLAPFAGRKVVAIFLMVLAASYALAALLFDEWGSFVYLLAVCVIALRGIKLRFGTLRDEATQRT